jgi:hypothetical protein
MKLIYGLHQTVERIVQSIILFSVLVAVIYCDPE